MIVDYASDMHINHWALWNNNQVKWENQTRLLARRLIENGHGEVIVLAGDFGEWNCQTIWFLDEVSKYYERVYFTYGNHDLYIMTKSQKKKYGDSLGRIEELVEWSEGKPNIFPLIKTIETYKGKTFAGDVLWYLPKDYRHWEFFKNVSNDSSYISINGYTIEYAVMKMWQDSLNWYDTLQDQHIDVMVSHVPPVHSPFSVFEPNYCYMVDVPFLASDKWIVGHDHLQNTFSKAGTTFYANCIGYACDYDNYKVNTIPSKDVDTYKSFELKSFTI